MEKNITKVKILGQDYKISCPPEESDQVKDAAKFFNKRLDVTLNRKVQGGDFFDPSGFLI